jgi:hypothetical protein
MTGKYHNDMAMNETVARLSPPAAQAMIIRSHASRLPPFTRRPAPPRNRPAEGPSAGGN